MGLYRAHAHQDHGSGASHLALLPEGGLEKPPSPPCRCGLSMTLCTGVALGVSVGKSPVDSIGGKWLGFEEISRWEMAGSSPMR